MRVLPTLLILLLLVATCAHAQEKEYEYKHYHYEMTCVTQGVQTLVVLNTSELYQRQVWFMELTPEEEDSIMHTMFLIAAKKNDVKCENFKRHEEIKHLRILELGYLLLNRTYDARAGEFTVWLLSEVRIPEIKSSY